MDANEEVFAAEQALRHLLKARDLLRQVGAPKTLLRVRQAISSAEGALRAAEGRAVRARSGRPIRRQRRSLRAQRRPRADRCT